MKKFCEKFSGGQKMAIAGCLFLVGLVMLGLTKGDGDKGYIGYLILKFSKTFNHYTTHTTICHPMVGTNNPLTGLMAFIS